MFYQVRIDKDNDNEDDMIMLEGEASGAIAKGGSGVSFFPEEAIVNSLDIIQVISEKLIREVSPTLKGTGASMQIEFSTRCDGNGATMIAQDMNRGQFKCILTFNDPDKG